MSAITFESTFSTFNILNPFNRFAEETHRVEVRKDPLLGDTSVYNPFLQDKAKLFFGENDRALLQKLADDTAATCVFCPAQVRERTAKYPPGLLPDGRIVSGEATLFANAFSVAAVHAVISLSHPHFLLPSQIGAGRLADGLRAARQFLRLMTTANPSAAYAAVCANYLQPAGASLVHPHMQLLASPVPYTYQGRMLHAAAAYRAKHGACYFDDLVRLERDNGARWIGTRGGWSWLAAFSPMGGCDVTAVHGAEQDLAGLSDDDLAALADGIARVLAHYEASGLLSFNFCLSSVRQDAPAEGFRCCLRVVARQNLTAAYRNDDYFLQKLLQTELILTLPEDLAAALRPSFAA